MKKVLILLVIFALAGIASANMLTNGDFLLGESDPDDPTQPNELNPVGWTEWTSGGWTNREINGNGTYGDTENPHMAIGNGGGYGAGVYQEVSASAGLTYIFSADAALDVWWMNSLYLKFEFFNAAGEEVGFFEGDHFSQSGYDVGLEWTNYSITATAPSGTATVRAILGTYGEGGTARFDNAVLVLDVALVASDPDPAVGEVGVLIDKTLSWSIAIDPCSIVTPPLAADPNLASHVLYINTEPNFVGVTGIAVSSWDAETLRASYTPSGDLLRDQTYYWSAYVVDGNGEEIEGPMWQFETELSVVQITDGPDHQIVDAGGDAVFSLSTVSISPVIYQWYKYVDGINDTLITGADAIDLTIANVDSADEGSYYCITNNGSGIEVSSDLAVLAIKRKLAHWDFEAGNIDSIVDGSPASVPLGEPVFVTDAGVSGDAMAFDAGLEEMLYTDLNEVAYFDVANINITVACWIKSTVTNDWAPLISRNGEDDGWQLRQGNADRSIFTARGTTGNVDGSAASMASYDGQWHFVVGTYDGEIKKLYIDGHLSKTYSSDDGTVTSMGDEVVGDITASAAPVAIAGRFQGEPTTVGDQFTTGTYDEIEIYNYALDAATIAQKYANVTGESVCPNTLVPASDLNGDCVVDLQDLALLASEWTTDTSAQPVQ